MSKTCVVCEKVFNQSNSIQNVCSYACKQNLDQRKPSKAKFITVKQKQLKSKKCKICKNIFEPRSSLQKVCSTECSFVVGRMAIHKKHELKIKNQLESLKTNTEWKNDLQVVVNEYIRLRDYGKPCVSCLRPFDLNHQRHASHFISRGASSFLRFNTLNIHASCAQCNGSMSGNILNYRKQLLIRFGIEFVEKLECSPTVKSFSVDYIKKAMKIFRKKIKKIKKIRKSIYIE